MNTETIAAIASGLSNSGISIIRISGEEAFSVADKIFKAVSGKTIEETDSFKVSYGHIIDNGKIIDEVLLLKMKAPHTYTRENIVEIDCHGGIVVTKAVLEAVLRAGARPAEPGEFTKRAFLNGRIDLSQAEAVSDIISAKSTLALKNSINQLRGDIKNKISELRDTLLSKTAFIEAALDDPEHYTLDGFDEALKQDINFILDQIRKLISSADNGRLIREGINTVILGRPNAGKSSLLNVILGKERAIVTDIAGTTRDTLEESVILDGIVLNMTDTAGIRETGNVIEKIGVDKAKQAALEADLVLYVIDATEGINSDDKEIIDLIGEKKIIYIINKTDICPEAFESLSLQLKTDLSKNSEDKIVGISALNNTGIDNLKDCIKNLFFNGDIDINDEIYITNIRQKNLLTDAEKSLQNVLTSIDSGMPEDFYSIDMMSAYTSLGLITGDNVEDDLADRIFSEFCMGK